MCNSFLHAWEKNISCRMHQISFAAKFILYSDASLNPFVYFLLNDRYRQGLRNILICREILPREVEMNDMA